MTPPVAMIKPIFVGNSHLAKGELRAYDGASNSWLPWAASATVRFCTMATDPETGEITYTTISGMGPFSLTPGVGAVFYYVVPTSVVDLLNVEAYLNQTVYQLMEGGPLSDLQVVQPLLVCPQRPPATP